MDKLRITGGNQLKGEINVSGAKNAALPILCAGLLTADTITLKNVPRLNDISTTLKLLGQMGVRCDRNAEICRAVLNIGRDIRSAHDN